jgi:hypothetical protein
MKNSILTVTVFVFTLISSLEVAAQEFKSLDKSPMDMTAFPSSYKISDKIVKVIYSRPQLKGRDLLKLAPPAKVWRTGANEAAEITFYKDVIFGRKRTKCRNILSIYYTFLRWRLDCNYQQSKKSLGFILLQ